MSLRQLLRKPFCPYHSTHPTLPYLHHFPISKPLRHPPFRLRSTSSQSQERMNRILARLPRFLHPYTNGLRTAPVSHIGSFLILHEITAIVPLVGLAGLFHYMEWVPRSMVEGRWVTEGMERFGRYFVRKGWFGFSWEGEGTAGESPGSGGSGGASDRNGGRESQESGQYQEGMIQETEKRWRVGEKGGRILVEVATAYAITKVLLPARILVSIWGTPWFARVVVGRVRGLLGKGKGGAGLGSKSAVARTGATGSGVVTKGGEGIKKMP